MFGGGGGGGGGAPPHPPPPPPHWIMDETWNILINTCLYPPSPVHNQKCKMERKYPQYILYYITGIAHSKFPILSVDMQRRLDLDRAHS